MTTSKSPNSLTLSQEGLPLVRDLMRPNPALYWADYIFCTTLGWVAFFLAGSEGTASWARPLWLLAASLFIYRSVIFVHELVHLKQGTVPFLRGVWMVLSIPLLIPLFSYDGVHLDHHRRNLYGTSGDGEYFPFVKKGRFFILLFFVGNLFVPIVLFIRHLFLTPLTWISKRIRRWTWIHVSSLAIDPAFARPMPADGKLPVLEPILSFLFCLGVTVTLYQGWISSRWAVLWFSMAAVILTFNALRTLAAHRYSNLNNTPLDQAHQHLDSVDIRGTFLSDLWAPVGLRYHATHHLFPSLPYHNLGKAHRRLNAGLVVNAELYRSSTRSGLFSALAELWQTAGRGEGVLVLDQKSSA